jgi:Xaa-Pro aminopeptidase
MLDRSVFAARRRAYLDALGPDSVAVVSSLPERLRNGDAHYHFRQHSDVAYLTGFGEPDATVILRPGAEGEEVVMFVRPRDPEMETWNGRRAGLEGVKADHGADVAYPHTELEQRLTDLLANREHLHYALGLDRDMDLLIAGAIARLRKLEKRGKRPPRAVVDPRAVLHELRLHKTADEIALLRRAAAISTEAHVAAMRLGRPGRHEYELEATINYTFRSQGGMGPGYGTIVGAGVNATILHYVDNQCPVADGDLVLVDAGCEYDYYTADITRTWPASGRFSGPQRAVYQLVLDTQKSAVAMCQPGMTLDDLHHHCVRKLTEGMIDLGLLQGPADARIEDLSYKRFFMHGTSHWLGMDVHDVGAYTAGGKARPLAPGMVITVEPGLYIAADAPDVPDALRGLGVRIEDDILITEQGHDNLTWACPKEIDALESICST